MLPSAMYSSGIWAANQHLLFKEEGKEERGGGQYKKNVEFTKYSYWLIVLWMDLISFPTHFYNTLKIHAKEELF